MLILGIDPGLDKVGVAYIEAAGQMSHLWSGLIKTDKSDHTVRRLQVLRDDLNEVLSLYTPDLVVVETLPPRWSEGALPTILNVAHARGVIMLTLADAGLEFVDIYSAQWKSHLGVDTKAKKKEIRQAVNDLFDLHGIAREDDENDAIGIAYGGYYQMGGM